MPDLLDFFVGGIFISGPAALLTWCFTACGGITSGLLLVLFCSWLVLMISVWTWVIWFDDDPENATQPRQAQPRNLRNPLARGVNDKAQKARLSFSKLESTAASQDNDDICVVCWSLYEAGQLVAELRCTHRYHVDCLVDWLDHSARCCVCSRALSSQRVVKIKKVE